MPVSRRTFLRSAAATAASIVPAARLLAEPTGQGSVQSPQRFDPWIEIIPANLNHNVATLRRLGGRPILAVVKNHGYGLDYRVVARLLEPNPEIEGFAIVRADEALELREQGIRKPILLMARAPDDRLEELATRGVTLAVYADDDPQRLSRVRATTGPIAVQAYIDTGMSRMGIAYHRAMPFLQGDRRAQELPAHRDVHDVHRRRRVRPRTTRALPGAHP